MNKDQIGDFVRGRWHYIVPHQPSVAKALQDLRDDVFEVGAFYKREQLYRRMLDRDRARMIQDMKDGIRQAIQREEEKSRAESIEELIERTKPASTRSILDVERIVTKPDCGAVAPMPDQLRQEIFRTDRPSRVQAEESLERAFRRIDANYYVVLYEGGDPHEILFIGYSALGFYGMEQQGVRDPIGPALMESNRESWKWLLSFVDDFLAERGDVLRSILLAAIDAGWDSYFRAGQSMTHLVFSTAEKHGLERIQPPPPRVTLGYDKGGKLFVAESRSNLWFSDPEKIDIVTSENASEILALYLMDLWTQTRPREAMPDVLATQAQ
jgi:hypothetical protein